MQGACLADASLLIEEHLGEAEATACDFACVLIVDEGDAFFAYFCEIDFPRLVGEVFGIVAWWAWWAIVGFSFARFLLLDGFLSGFGLGFQVCFGGFLSGL